MMTDELKEPRWVVGNNMPDAEPCFFSNWRHAVDCFLWSLELALDDEEENGQGHRYTIERQAIARLQKAIKAKRKAFECQLNIDGQVYWLQRV